VSQQQTRANSNSEKTVFLQKGSREEKEKPKKAKKNSWKEEKACTGKKSKSWIFCAFSVNLRSKMAPL
jgi:hypothetical protein